MARLWPSSRLSFVISEAHRYSRYKRVLTRNENERRRITWNCIKLALFFGKTIEQIIEDCRTLESEIEVLRKLRHRNIVRYIGAQREKEGCPPVDVLNVFLEYVPGGSIHGLIQEIGCFDESLIRVYTKQILVGLDYLHGKNVVHRYMRNFRLLFVPLGVLCVECTSTSYSLLAANENRDIKGMNILVHEDGIVKLADFGASRTLESLHLKSNPESAEQNIQQSIRGTPQFMVCNYHNPE